MPSFLRMLHSTADCRDDKDIDKQFRRKNAFGNMLVRQEVLNFTNGGKYPSVEVILLPNLWVFSLASFIQQLY